MKKCDREKLENLAERMVKGYKYCFTEESSNKYLRRFSEMKADSSLYNGDVNNLRLEIFKLEDGSYLDVSEEDEISEDNKHKYNEVREYIAKQLRLKFREILPIYFEELKAENKKQKELEKESKGKDK